MWASIFAAALGLVQTLITAGQQANAISASTAAALQSNLDAMKATAKSVADAEEATLKNEQ
jgi:hypothetical protein